MDYINCSLMGTTKLEQLDIVNSSVVETKTLHRMYRLMLRNEENIRKALIGSRGFRGSGGTIAAGKYGGSAGGQCWILSSVGVEREGLVDYQCSSTYIYKIYDEYLQLQHLQHEMDFDGLTRNGVEFRNICVKLEYKVKLYKKSNPSLLKIYICNRLTHNKN